MDPQSPNLSPVKIHKLWLLYPLIVPTLISIFDLVLCLILVLILPSANASPNYALMVAILMGAVLITSTIYILALLGSLLSILLRYLERENFQVVVDKSHLIVKSGILSKSERTIPYNVIQNLAISNSLTDTFLGVSTLEIENASGSMMTVQSNTPGFTMGNNVTIPCLSTNEAISLRNIVSEKIKEFNKITTFRGI